MEEENLYLRQLNDSLEELRRSEEKLRHFQRLETIGTLTGGMAHELNNLLTPIMACSMMLMDDVTPGQELSLIHIYLSDIAGIRVICSFIEDIYQVAEMFTRQDDVRLLEVKDYIKHPKDNGYRSLHLIIGIPIFLSSEKKYVRVEVQFRTIAMDFWASLDHKLKYKKNVKNPELIAAELKKCADTISSVDLRMQEIRNMMEEGEM